MKQPILLFVVLSAVGALPAIAEESPDVQEMFDIRFGFAEDKEVDVFLPLLQKTLTVELHFAKRLCRPNESQFREIHRRGIEKVVEVASEYATLQQQRASPATWPDPNEAIASALAEKIDQILPSGIANEYRQETSARFDANRVASARVIVNLIDHEVHLSLPQRERLLKALCDQWQMHWSKGSVIFRYAQMATLPETHSLQDYLTEAQLRLWDYRSSRRRVTPSWMIYFGEHDMLSADDLPSFPDPGPAERANGPAEHANGPAERANGPAERADAAEQGSGPGEQQTVSAGQGDVQ